MPLSGEKELVLSLQKGNSSAFEKIFSIYNKRIYNFCFSLLQSANDAQEITQRVFVALWEQHTRIDEDKSLTAYLYSIARHMVYQQFRHQIYKKAAFDHFSKNSSGFKETTKDDVLFNELVSFLENTIEKLPERQREVFKLSRFSELTYKQIAGKLNISENTVDTQIRRALKFIREEYNLQYH